MTDLTERLDAIQARVDAATPGPWEAGTLDGHDADVFTVATEEDLGRWVICEHAGADAAFIAAAPSDVAFLLDLARKQGAAIAALSQWAGRAKTGYYDEAQDDVVQIIRPALEAKP